MALKLPHWLKLLPDSTDPTYDADPGSDWLYGGGLSSWYLPPDHNGPTFDTAPSIYAVYGDGLASSISGSAAGTGSAGTGSAGTGSTRSSATVTTVATGSFVVNITWDSSVSSAPAAFKTAITNAVQYLEGLISTTATININVGWGEADGYSLGTSALGESLSNLVSVSYATLLNALKANNTSATDASVIASLPASSPTGGTYWLTYAQAKALGLSSVLPASSTDGYVGFSSALPFSYGGATAGAYDFNGVALHEFTEVMGRILLTGATIGSYANSYSLMDLLHFSAQGTRVFTASTPGYFSPDGGSTNLGAFNTVAGGDAGDWASSVRNDSFDAFDTPGVVNPLTANDATVMDALGWTLASSGGSSPPPTSTSTPTGISVSPLGASLSQAGGSNGLAGSKALASITQTGGATSDSYTYTLSGSTLFALSVANNTATLLTGSGVTAGTSPTLYALTVTPTDTTSGNSGPAVPINVVVGTSGNDSISLTKNAVPFLPVALQSAPSFIFGLAGKDTIDGSGMTSKLYFDVGVGGDTLTGGSGGNDYLFGATADSTPSAMAVITNFSGADVIDLTGLGTALTNRGKFGGTSLAAHSVGWQQVGGSTGNVFVYVNTGTRSVSLNSASMKIELAYNTSLPSTPNILHA